VKYLQSTTQSDYVPNINNVLGEKCKIIVTVGLPDGRRDGERGREEPDPGLRDRRLLVCLGLLTGAKESNIDQLTFNTVQDGFLGGYLAAGMSKSGRSPRSAVRTSAP